MNKAIIMGRLSGEPVFSQTESGVAKCRFTVAVQESYKNKDGSRNVDFLDCVAWRSTADFVSKFFHILTIPWVLFGFVRFQGMPFEDYILSWLRFNLFPQKRVYEDTDNSLLQELHEELLEKSIQQQHIDKMCKFNGRYFYTIQKANDYAANL